MTEQHNRLVQLVRWFRPKEITHGDCEGGDENFHIICNLEGVEYCWIRPGVDSQGHPKHRAYCHRWRDNFKLLVIEPPEPFLIRDTKIVKDSQLLVGCPKGFVEEKRFSGTWYTILQARKLHVPCLIIFPDGNMGLEENA